MHLFRKRLHRIQKSLFKRLTHYLFRSQRNNLYLLWVLLNSTVSWRLTRQVQRSSKDFQNVWSIVTNHCIIDSLLRVTVDVHWSKVDRHVQRCFKVFKMFEESLQVTLFELLNQTDSFEIVAWINSMFKIILWHHENITVFLIPMANFIYFKFDFLKYPR